VKCNWSAQFWADHKAVLPIHYAVDLAEVSCKEFAAANVESVLSGVGQAKLTAEAPSTGAELLSRMVKLHYNWKYLFHHPTMSQINERYNLKFHESLAGAARVDATANDPTAAPTAAPAAVAAPVTTNAPTAA